MAATNQLASVSSSSSMPPPPPRRPAKVLPEDEYTDAIAGIIERDFFPEVPKLHNQLEWLEAVNSGNPALIRQAQIKIAHRRAGLQTPAGTAGGVFSKPNTAGTGAWERLHTPVMTPVLGGIAPSSTTGDEPGTATAAKAPSLSLDAFFAGHTSEDNASFQEIKQAEAQRKKAKLSHYLEPPPATLAIEGPRPTDEYGTSGQPVSTLVPWKHESKSKLYYDSSNYQSLPLTEKELLTQTQGPPKAINHQATRLPTSSSGTDTASGTAAGPGGGLVSATPRGTFAAVQTPLLVGGALPAGGTIFPGEEPAAGGHKGVPPPQVGGKRGYNYVATPSPAPGVDESPFMTWGELGSTPIRLDMDDTPLDLTAASGPQFRMPEARKREEVARNLAKDKTSNRQKTAAGGVLSPALALLKKGTTPLSDAGKKLASVLRGRMQGETDSQLRVTYSGRGTTPLRSVTGTGSTPVVKAVNVTAKKKIVAAPGGAKDLDTPTNGDITDGLLKL